MNKCIICKRNSGEETLCTRLSCKEKYEARNSINEKYKVYKEFWNGKEPTHDNYRDYFILIGKEEKYIKYALDFINRNLTPPSRRVYYQFNIASVHDMFHDEYGRYFTEGCE